MWSALTSSSNFVLESLETFVESTGIAGLLANMGWGSLVMICVAFFLLYLAIKHKFEPLLLLTIAFGMLLTNLPEGMSTGIFSWRTPDCWTTSIWV